MAREDDDRRADDLLATSDSISDDAGRLGALESAKRALDPKDPRVAELSREAETVAKSLATKAGVERAISEEIQEAR